jgi:hypothetical protein
MKEISNRSAIVLYPKRPFNEWAELHNESPREELEKRKNENHVYLIDWKYDEDMTEVLKPYYKIIFEYELSSWNSYEHEWPKNRTYERFLEWFDVRFYDDLFDLEEGKITKEKL